DFAASQHWLLSKIAEASALVGMQATVPSYDAVHTLAVQQASLLPGQIALGVLLFSLGVTCLTQLFSILAAREGEKALFTEKRRAYRLGALPAVLYLLVLLVNIFYQDYTSVFSLVCMNAVTLLSPLFALGGLSFLPRIRLGMRRAEGGRGSYRIWFFLFLLLCVYYASFALTLFGVAHAISILKNAIRPPHGNG
ncbi:MAG: hypothetical protein J6T24_01030, partial [Clostridia bacterium]|nr:hypothetical protein [Clostridia bacterium]